jgi:hypothetical protein
VYVCTHHVTGIQKGIKKTPLTMVQVQTTGLF